MGKGKGKNSSLGVGFLLVRGSCLALIDVWCLGNHVVLRLLLNNVKILIHQDQRYWVLH